MNHSLDLGALATAKARAQVKFLPITKDREAQIGGRYSYRYADLAACLEAVMPALSEAGLALFQPVRCEEGTVIVTTLLVHGESGQWIAEEYRLVVADPSDPRSVASATTYGRRYGVTSLLCVASSEEDDDAEAARGGDHEMAPPKGTKACPACGVIGAMIPSKPEYGGGWLCWKNKGGCGTKYPPGPFPTSAPETEMMPKAKGPVPAPAATVDRTSDPLPQTVSTVSSSITAAAEIKQGASHDVVNVGGNEPEQPMLPEIPPVAAKVAAAFVPGGKVRFILAGVPYETNGITESQFLETAALAPKADKRISRGYSKTVLAKILGVKVSDPTCHRTYLTEEQAARWIETLKEAARTAP